MNWQHISHTDSQIVNTRQMKATFVEAAAVRKNNILGERDEGVQNPNKVKSFSIGGTIAFGISSKVFYLVRRILILQPSLCFCHE